MVQVNVLYPKIQSGKIELDNWYQIVIENNQYLDLGLIKTSISFLQDLKNSNNISYNDHDFLSGLETATILTELKMDTDSIVVGLLISIYNNKKNNTDNINLILEKITQIFNKNITTLLDGVIKMDAIRHISSNMSNSNTGDKFRKMLLAMVSDPRVVVISLADHLCELRACKKQNIAIQQELANETRFIFAPLANRLGIGQLKWELEDLSFRYLEPDLYKQIAKNLDEKRINRDQYIVNLIDIIKINLQKNNIEAEVTGRVKHIYSIWRKMHRKSLNFDDLYDIRAVRIIVKNITECYTALGIVHSLWHYIPKEFDDYIATPKENGYQSLHTAVVGPEGKTVEVQIRTEQMHNDSELGVAAHWRYKEGVAFDSSFEAKIAWLRQIIDWQDELSSKDTDLLEEIKNNIAEDRVYVLTPNGDVFDLPEAATPLDFAYHVHTDIGNKCIGAKINNKIVPLTYKLETGDRIEILTRSNANPSLDWLNPHFGFVTTSRARSKIQSWFKKQDYSKNLSIGKELLDKELHRFNIKHNDINLNKIAQKLNYKTIDNLIAAIGYGEVKSGHILNLSGAVIKAIEQESNTAQDLPHISKNIKSNKTAINTKTVQVSGVDNLLTSIANCCKPIPGNPIIGYVTQERGITIHNKDCLNIKHIQEINPERLIDVNWDKNAANLFFAVDILIEAIDRQDLLRDIINLLSSEKIKIINMNTAKSKQGLANIYLSIEISSVEDLGKILDKLQALPNVNMAKKISK